MPNWCDTEYRVVGPKEELDELYNVLEAMNGTPIGESDFGCNWIGDAILRMGLKLEDYPRHRGEITWVDYDHESLVQITQNTAWCEQPGFRHAIEARFPNCKVYWQDEEPGCDNYATNDAEGTMFDERYKLDACIDDEYTAEYFDTLEDAKEYISSNFEVDLSKADTLDAVNDVLHAYLSGHEDTSYFALREFEIVMD